MCNYCSIMIEFKERRRLAVVVGSVRTIAAFNTTTDTAVAFWFITNVLTRLVTRWPTCSVLHVWWTHDC